jgi:hypothetical protein
LEEYVIGNVIKRRIVMVMEFVRLMILVSVLINL